MGDFLTILRSPTKPLCKVWKSDGTIAPYAQAKWFEATIEPVADLAGLSALLTSLEPDPHACLIRGAPNDARLLERPLRRLSEHFDDTPLHTLLVDVDGYEPLTADPVTEPEAAIREFVGLHLPEPFHGASFHWQLSNSAGAAGNEAVLKAHLWFWLATPRSSAVLRAWAKAEELAVDLAVYNPVQIHYLAAPVFEPGAVDPVPRRSGLYRGALDAVPLAIEEDALRVVRRGPRQRGARTEGAEDPVADWLCEHWETWGGLPNGGLVISCPFELSHTSGRKDGDTSTVYFPAGTNGYAEGMFVCLHGHCQSRSKNEFLAEAGYTDARLGQLAEPLPEGAVNGHALPQLVGRTAQDPLVLPPFKRGKGGVIDTTLDNLRMALESRLATGGLTLRKDRFKGALMCADEGDDALRPFTDVDYTELRIRLEKIGFKLMGREVVRDAVHHCAEANGFDSAQDWLNALTWDGVPRIDRFWIDHLGVEDDAAGYARSVGAYTWTALAGRVLAPGVKADMVPILVGPQGVGKSAAIKALAPDEDMFTEMSFSDDETERARKMRGTLVIELGELKGLKSREREEILSWVTRSAEHWTPKYQEMSGKFLRRCLLLGTSNKRDFLDDPTGERRWLPMDSGLGPGEFVDVDAIAAVRDQLWAEGAARFNAAGVAWEAAQRLACGVHHRYKADDLWTPAVQRWLTTADLGGETPGARDTLTLLEVAEGALGLAARMLRPADQGRIGKILAGLGYVEIAAGGGKVWIKPDFV